MILLKLLLSLLIAFSVDSWQLASSIRFPTRLMISGNRKPLMGGNWKLNPTTVEDAKILTDGIIQHVLKSDYSDVVIYPPYPLLPAVAEKLKDTKISLGAQDCFYEPYGAYTGAVSTNLLVDIGVKHVLIGHSERRTIFKEDDAMINEKVLKALDDGLKVVLCVGESLDQYNAGSNREVCRNQVVKGLEGVKSSKMENVIIAYEPCWAIGTGLVCPKEVAQDVCCFIRSVIQEKYNEDISKNVVIQYGGSVNVKNAKDLMEMPDIDGCLIGGASLNPEQFGHIVDYKNINDAMFLPKI